MADYRLNPRSKEKLLALIRAGKTINVPFSFSVLDQQDLAGPMPINWTEYSSWFLGLREGAPDPASDVGIQPTVADYAFPFGKGVDGLVYLAALKEMVRGAHSPQDISDAAQQALDMNESQKLSRVTANSPRYLDQLERLSIGEAQSQHAGRYMSFNAGLRIAAEAPGRATPKRFSMVAYTGGPMRLEGWKNPVVIDLDGLGGLDRAHPSFRSHDDQKIIGHVDRVWVQGGKLLAEGVISGANDSAREVLDSIASGFPWQASIGASTHEVEFVPKGQTGRANGRDWPGPVSIARRSTLGEISFVPRGADSSTSVTIGARATELDVMLVEHRCRVEQATAGNDARKQAIAARIDSTIDKVFRRFGV